MMYGILLILAVAFIKHRYVSAVRCFECTDMPHPQDCPTITTCTQYEMCYVEQYVTSGGLVLYNSGCLSKNRCQISGKRELMYNKTDSRIYKPHLQHRPIIDERPLVSIDDGAPAVAKRQQPASRTDIITCIQCCHGDYCDVEGCGTTAVPRKIRGPKCFSCPAQSDTESCRDVTVCDIAQVCAIYKPLNRLTHGEWTTECMGELQCKAIVKIESAHLPSSIVGKRDVFQVNRCPRCCSDDLCNHSCRQNLTVTPASATPASVTTIGAPTHPQHTTKTIHRPTTKATPKPTKATPKPTTKATHRPTTKATHRSTTKATHRPTTKATHRPTTKAMHRPTTKATHRPTTKATHKPTTKATHKPTTKATHKPTTKATPKLTRKATLRSTTKATPKPTTKATPPPTTRSTPPTPTTDPAIGCKVDGYIYQHLTALCLKFYETPELNWTDAQAYCNKTKGQLAIVTGDQKIRDVLDFYTAGGYTTPQWIGATDLGNGHVFVYPNGAKVIVDPAAGQDLTNANCLYVINGSYKAYGPCSEKHGFICERKSTVRP